MVYNELEQGDILAEVRVGLASRAYSDISLRSIWGIFKIRQTPVLPTEKQITIDPTYAEKRLVKKVRFRGDFGLLFEVQAEHYDDVVKDKQEIIQADGQTVTRLTLEVRGWQWVKK